MKCRALTKRNTEIHATKALTIFTAFTVARCPNLRFQKKQLAALGGRLSIPTAMTPMITPARSL